MIAEAYDLSDAERDRVRRTLEAYFEADRAYQLRVQELVLSGRELSHDEIREVEDLRSVRDLVLHLRNEELVQLGWPWIERDGSR